MKQIYIIIYNIVISLILGLVIGFFMGTTAVEHMYAGKLEEIAVYCKNGGQ